MKKDTGVVKGLKNRPCSRVGLLNLSMLQGSVFTEALRSNYAKLCKQNSVYVRSLKMTEVLEP